MSRISESSIIIGCTAIFGGEEFFSVAKREASCASDRQREICSATFDEFTAVISDSVSSLLWLCSMSEISLLVASG